MKNYASCISSCISLEDLNVTIPKTNTAIPTTAKIINFRMSGSFEVARTEIGYTTPMIPNMVKIKPSVVLILILLKFNDDES
jgi:hypothetical protein